MTGSTEQIAPPSKAHPPGRRCPRCGELSAHRSIARTVYGHLLRSLLFVRPYSCHRCGWRGWRLWWWKGARVYEIPSGPSEDELRRRRRARRRKERKKFAASQRNRLLRQVAVALALGVVAGVFFYLWYGAGGD